MGRSGRGSLVAAAAVVVMIVAAVAGCGLHLPEAPSHAKPCAWQVPAAQRHRVHVFLVHGFDLADCANLVGMQEHLTRQGYRDTRLFEYTECPRLAQAMVETKKTHPDEPIALVGFSLGCIAARRVTHEVHAECGLAPELLFYMGGWFLGDNAESRPPFVPKVIHVLGSSCDNLGQPLTGAENLRVESFHFGTPTHPRVVAKLEAELELLAGVRPLLGQPCVRR